MDVKVQLPLAGEPMALVYNKARTVEFQMPIFDNLKNWMSGAHKKYFKVKFIPDPDVKGGEKMIIVKELTDIEW